jgi:hypothetical protein
VRNVTVKVYGTPPSHPSHAARLMVEHKGIDHKMIWLRPGMHPALEWLEPLGGR